MKVELTLPPPLNQTYRYGNGNYYKTKEAKEWEEQAGWEIKKAWKRNPYKKDVYVGIVMAVKRDRDIDSCLKIVLDILQKQRVIENDKQILHLNVLKTFVESNPGLSIEVEELA